MSSLALLTVTIEPLEDACLIRVSGELDLNTADRLSSALDAARADGVTTLLELTAVSFIDLAGLRVLLRLARPVEAHNWAWFIVRAFGVVWRLVEVSGTTSRLPLWRRRRAPSGSDTQDRCSASRGLTARRLAAY